jgi:hypothetical protein
MDEKRARVLRRRQARRLRSRRRRRWAVSGGTTPLVARLSGVLRGRHEAGEAGEEIARKYREKG